MSKPRIVSVIVWTNWGLTYWWRAYLPDGSETYLYWGWRGAIAAVTQYYYLRKG